MIVLMTNLFQSIFKGEKHGQVLFKLPKMAGFPLVVATLIVNVTTASFSLDKQRVVVTVDDRPITDYDVDQRMKLDDISGLPADERGERRRRAVVEELIEDKLKRIEAERLEVSVPADSVDEALSNMARSNGLTVDGMKAKLAASGIALDELKNRIMIAMAWNRVLSSRYQISTEVGENEIDRRLASINADPARKKRKIYKLREIDLPLEDEASANEQAVYSRVLEAQSIIKRFTGCADMDKAVSGVFNVKIRDPVDVAPDSLTAPLRTALDSAGPGRIIGPARSSAGLQLIAFCAVRLVSPPAFSRKHVKAMIINERYDMYSQRYLRDLKRHAFIDYKVPAYKP